MLMENIKMLLFVYKKKGKRAIAEDERLGAEILSLTI